MGFADAGRVTQTAHKQGNHIITKDAADTPAAADTAAVPPSAAAAVASVAYSATTADDAY